MPDDSLLNSKISFSIRVTDGIKSKDFSFSVEVITETEALLRTKMAKETSSNSELQQLAREDWSLSDVWWNNLTDEEKEDAFNFKQW